MIRVFAISTTKKKKKKNTSVNDEEEHEKRKEDFETMRRPADSSRSCIIVREWW